MALSIQLQEIANKSAGVYQLVINNTNRARITPPTTLRLVPINSRRGPVNSLVYINKQDYKGLEEVFGGISSRDERHGNFGIRIAEHCLENGPVLVMNLRRFDDTMDKAGVKGLSAVMGEKISNDTEEAFTELYNTERLWFPDPERLGEIDSTKEYGVSIANVGSKKLSVFIRKSTVKGWDMTVKDWYTKKGKQLPEYVDPYSKMCDTFLDVFVFQTDFSNAKTNLANENYGHLFTETGIKAMYVDNMGVEHDPLNELAQIDDAQFVRKYTGSLIDDLVDASNNVMALASLVNAYAATDGLMMYVNPTIIQADAILDYDSEINGAKRPFGIDFMGAGRFGLADVKADVAHRKLNDKIVWDGQTPVSVPQFMSHPAESSVYGKTEIEFNKTVDAKPWVLEKAEQVDKTVNTQEEVDQLVAAGWTIKTEGNEAYTLPVYITETPDTDKNVAGRMIDCWVKKDEKGIVEAYTINHPLIKSGDYLIGNDSNLVSVTSSNGIGTIGKEYSVVKIGTNAPIMFKDSLAELAAGSVTLTLDDNSTIEGLTKTALYLIYDTNLPAEGESLVPMILEAYTPRAEQFCDGTPARQKEILDLLNEPSFIKGMKILTEYKFRYVVDPFKTYIEPAAKANLANFAETLNVRVISSMPFTYQFRKSTNPYFRKTPKSPLEVAYIEKGGNSELVASNSFSLPVDAADKIWFFGPGMKNNSTGREEIVPFTGAVAKAFLNKFIDGTLFPYTICANETGILSVNGMVSTENEWTDDERDYLERMGYNPIITQENIGVTIYGNQTASQRVLSDLSKIHVSELILTIQEEMRKMLKNYVFKYNNYQTRLEIYTKAEEIMKQIYSNGGVYWYQNVIDTTNNTLEVINNSMGILDTQIVATKGGEKWVHRTYLETGAGIAGFELIQA